VGVDRGRNLRNLAIIVVLAVAVWKLPGGGTASTTISNLLSLIFLGGLFFFAYRMYMEHRDTISGLEDRTRGILYGALALGAFTLTATRRMWDAGGLTVLLWLAFMCAAGYGLYFAWRASRAY
jgi:hypothetical protein